MQVDKGRILHETLACLQGLEPDQGLLLQPFKKDRSVCISFLDGAVAVVEKGFVEKEYLVGKKKIKKLLKGICKREFPRSNKIWLQQLSSQELALFLSSKRR